jgi:hypothetical protein
MATAVERRHRIRLDAHDSSPHPHRDYWLLPDHGTQAAPKGPVDTGWGVRQGQSLTAPWRAVGLFLLLTICLSGIFWVLINATQTVNAAYIFGLMWMPAVAAILT